jgi:uncharacterized protein (TIGR00255 family)
MTGFGRGEFTDEKRRIITEIKAVNHRYADISVKMPKRYSFAEEAVKNTVKSVAKRGKIDVGIIVDNITEDDINIKLSEPAAEKYYNSLTELKDRFSLAGDISLDLLASFPDVLRAIPDVSCEEEVLRSVEASAAAAVGNFDVMRVTEGNKLAEDILMRGVFIENLVLKIEAAAPDVIRANYEKLKERIRELTEGSVEIPEERIVSEAAVAADKGNITEEIVRLKSHIGQMRAIIENSRQPEGRKLDFLVQEMNREANTMGSKSNNIEITNMVLDIKSEIEKIREQVQNIE